MASRAKDKAISPPFSLKINVEYRMSRRNNRRPTVYQLSLSDESIDNLANKSKKFAYSTATQAKKSEIINHIW
jgi:hypothetical protein